VRSVALPVCGAIQVAVARDGAATGDIQGGTGTAAELLVRNTHARVLNVNRRPRSCSAARISADAIQSPGCGLHAHVLLQLRNHRVLLVGRNKLHCTLVAVNHLLQLCL